MLERGHPSRRHAKRRSALHRSDDPGRGALCWDGLVDLRTVPPIAWLRRAHARHPVVVEATATAVAGLVLVALDIKGLWPRAGAFAPGELSHWWHLVPVLLGCLLMLVKRRMPLLALAGGVLLFVADTWLGGNLAMLLIFFDLLYAAVYWSSARVHRMLQVTIVALVAAATVVPLALAQPLQTAVLSGLQAFTFLGAPYWWATAVRRSRELAELSAARADDLERLAELQREEAVRDERASMARDLHDAIASNLSAVAIHSGAALARPVDSGRDRAALEAVRAASIDGLEQMRSMIAMLRGGEEPLTAPLSLAQAIEQSGAEVVGEPPELATAGDQAAARIVAESIANARKHAPGSAVTVRFESEPDATTVVITSTGGTPAAAVGTGHGIVMMRERAERVGGALHAGPVAGGWAVRASIPSREHS